MKSSRSIFGTGTENIFAWFAALLLVIGAGFFLVGTGLVIPKGSAAVTGMAFADVSGSGLEVAPAYPSGDVMRMRIVGVKNFVLDDNGYAWIDINVRLMDAYSGRIVVQNSNIFGDRGKTMIISPDGVNPFFGMPLRDVDPGRYRLEVDLVDRNDNYRIVQTFVEIIVVT